MMKTSSLTALLLLAQMFMSPAFAQATGNDIEVQGSDILRVCRQIHRAPQAQDPAAIATAQGITFNCRLVNANGSTLAQVSPEEVCERLTGGPEWYRGAGTQVFCRADGKKTRAVPVPCPQPTDEQIDSVDVSRACQKFQNNGNASAEPLRMTANGPEFNCRLVNSAGFTISGISPEQVCEVKTGRRHWCYTETTSYCRGADYVEPAKPAPGPLPAPGPEAPKPESPGPEAPGPLAPEPQAPDPEKPKAEEIPAEPKAEDIQFCKPQVPGGDIVVRITGFQKERPGYTVVFNPLVTCNSDGGMPPEKLCPSVTGSTDWYLSANGFENKNGLLWPTFIAVCRGSGPRERIAYANIARVCQTRGFPLANTGVLAGREPVCSDSNLNLTPIAISDVCNTLYGTRASKAVGPLYWCLP